MTALVAAGVWTFARADADRAAEQVARQVAVALGTALSRHDLAGPAGAQVGRLRADLSPFLDAGMVDRVKVWTVRGDEARVVVSDERRVEGETISSVSRTVPRPAVGEVAVRSVPEDAEHRFESALAGSRLEAFVPFEDAGGHRGLLEVYVPVDVAATATHAAAVLFPPVLVGLLLLALGTVPLSMTFAHRVEHDRVEQRAARRYGLAAADLSRRELAQRLHDTVIPDLAGAGLLLETVRSGAGRDVPWHLLDRVHEVVVGDVRRLRGLLDELLPATSTAADLATALRGIVDRLRTEDRGTNPEVVVDVRADPSDDRGVILCRVAGELLRNAFVHAAAATIRVEVRTTGGTLELSVADDGVGFVPGTGPRPGHVGLLLVRQVVRDGGGQVVVVSAAGAGTTVTVRLPPAAAIVPLA